MAEREVMVKQPDVGQMLQLAIEKGMDVSVMEKLIAMHDHLKAQWAKEQYFAAMSKFQSECPEIPKDKAVLNSDKKTVRYHYAPMSTVIKVAGPALWANGFSFTVKTQVGDGKVIATVRAMHKDGHVDESSFMMPIERGSYMNPLQQVGSARTYALRYALEDVFGIVTTEEDDDGQAGGEAVKLNLRKRPDPVPEDVYPEPTTEEVEFELTGEAENAPEIAEDGRGAAFTDVVAYINSHQRELRATAPAMMLRALAIKEGKSQETYERILKELRREPSGE